MSEQENNQVLSEEVKYQAPLADHDRIQHRPVGKARAIVATVFGSMLTGGFGLGSILALTLNGHPSMVLTFGALLTVGFGLDAYAFGVFKRLKRYRRYLSLFRHADFVLMEEVEEYMNKSHKYLVKDLRKMMESGMFPDLHMTKGEEMLILTKSSYDRYILEQRRRKLLMEDQISLESSGLNKPKMIGESNNELVKGRAELEKINRISQDVRSVLIRDKANVIESITKQILNHIENNPEQVGNVYRFAEHYLPTTVRLLDKYVEFEKHGVKSQHVIDSMEEISLALDKINEAFVNLFNNMFAGLSVDIQADISVLDTLLSEEGLIENPSQLSLSSEP